jgi:hypothetical protein
VFVYRDWCARAEAALAHVARSLADHDAARSHAAAALRHARDRGSYLALVDALPAAAGVLLDGEPLRATEIYALACMLPAVANSVWFDDVVGKPIALAAGSLPAAVVAAAKERGRARDVNATLDELIAEWGE